MLTLIVGACSNRRSSEGTKTVTGSDDVDSDAGQVVVPAEPADDGLVEQDSSSPSVSEEQRRDPAQDSEQTEGIVETSPEAALTPDSQQSPSDGGPSDASTFTEEDEAQPDPSELPADDVVTDDSSTDAAATEIFGVLLLDDGEDGDAHTVDGSFTGTWYTYDDTNQCDNENPTGEVNPVPDEQGGPAFTMTSYAGSDVSPPPEEGNVGNNYAVRFWGGGHSLWGAGTGVALDATLGTPNAVNLDALGVTLLRFWAKATNETDIAVSLSDQFSDPLGGRCVPRDEDVCGPQGCLDHPSTRISLTEDWSLFELPLSQFLRQGWGIHGDDEPTPTLLDKETVYQMHFIPWGTESFDIWIDNVGFVLQYPRGAECALPPVTSITCDILEPADARLDEMCFPPEVWESEWPPPAATDVGASEACPPPEVVLPSRPTAIRTDCSDVLIEICESGELNEAGHCCYSGILQEVDICCDGQ